ncbi:uncharacterized protein LOC144539465 [Centroberyx gerrardi]
MAIADMLIDKISSWLEQQKDCAKKLMNLATELESHTKNVKISQTVGSSASVVGAAAVTAAGLITLCTGGAAVPLLAVAGSVTAGLGVTTSLGSEIVEGFISGSTRKDAEKIAEKSKDLAKEIQRLMELLVKEGEKEQQKARVCTDEDYVVDCIIKAMAKRSGLEWNDNLKLLNIVSDLSKNMLSGKDATPRLLQKAAMALPLLSIFVIELAAEAILRQAAKKTGKAVLKKGLTKSITSVGRKAAAKAIGRVGGGAIGLVFSVSELIDNCTELVRDNFVTEASQSLRDAAKSMETTVDEMKRELDGIRKVFEKLAKVNRCIENLEKNSEEKELMDFAMENCKDEATLKWLKENSESEAFFKLVRMFHFLKKHIDEEEKKDHSKDIDIIFVAHGAIRDHMIPASCLTPLPTIKDVILYSPWNCTITADAAYGIAVGCMEPHHRVFVCGKISCLKFSHRHQPTDLPNHWNSMKKAGHQQIPNIMLSPLGPKDGAWKRFEFLKNEHGLAERNRVVVPYIIPGEDGSESVPFFVVTLALSLVLIFSRFQATVHLTACLGKISKRTKFDEDYLKDQYAYTIDHTCMKPSRSMPLNKVSTLYRVFKALFG